MYSPRVEKAIQKAGVLHRTQSRKGEDDLPYITHLISVALIARQYCDDEDVFIAALLHDSVEDTEYTKEALEKDFGERVAAIVAGVTEPEGDVAWEEKKRVYVENLRGAPEESLVIAAADKIHNLRSVTRAYETNKEQFWCDFSGTKESRLEFYKTIVSIIHERLDNPIVPVLQNAFNEYREFLAT